MRTETICVKGEPAALAAQRAMLDRSAWFVMIPCPFNYWEFEVKTGEGHIDAIAAKLSPGEEHCRGQGRTLDHEWDARQLRDTAAKVVEMLEPQTKTINPSLMAVRNAVRMLSNLTRGS